MPLFQRLKSFLSTKIKEAETRRIANAADMATRAETKAWLKKGIFTEEQLDPERNPALAHYLSPTHGEKTRRKVQDIAKKAGLAGAGLAIIGVVGIFGTIAYSTVLATYAMTTLNIGVLTSFAAIGTATLFKKLDQFHRTSKSKRLNEVVAAAEKFGITQTAPRATAKLDRSAQNSFNTAGVEKQISRKSGTSPTITPPQI